MMGFAWLSMVFHIILVSISWCSKARQQLLQRGCRVHWVHFRIAHGRWVGHLIKFDFPSILIEARSMMAETNFPHHCRKLWGTMTEGMFFF